MPATFHPDALAFARENRLVHLATVDGDKPQLRVMHTARVDDDFTLWFATFVSSAKASQIEANPAVCAGVASGEASLLVLGDAELVRDPALLRELWHESWRTYFPGGPEDPEYAALKVTAALVEFQR